MHILIRYETLFLPMHQKWDNFLHLNCPPLDIHWIWHCHMLAPYAYRADCQAIIGTVPDHRLPVRHESKSDDCDFLPSAELHEFWRKYVSVSVRIVKSL